MLLLLPPYAPAIREPSEDADTSQGPAVQAGLPLRLQLTGSASGNPDLRLQLLSVKAGTACERVQHHQAPNQQNAAMAGVSCPLIFCIAHDYSWQQQQQQQRVMSCNHPYCLPNMGRPIAAMQKCTFCMRCLMLYKTLLLCIVSTVSRSCNCHNRLFLCSCIGELFQPKQHDITPMPSDC